MAQSNSFVDNFDASIATAFGALVKATKAAGRLGDDIAYHRTLDESVDTRLEQASQRTLSMANHLWMTSRADSSLPITAADDIAINTEGQWTSGPQFSAVIDAVDTLLERIDVGLDELAKNSAHQLRNSVGAQSAAVVTSVAGRDVRVVHAQNMPRPQLQFRDAIDNSPNTPFVWRIRTKPHARVPLDYGLPSAAVAGSTLGQHLQTLGISRPGTPGGSGAGTPRRNKPSPELSAAQLSEALAGTVAALPHPYEYEIKHYEAPPRLFAEAEAQAPRDWDTTPFTFVDTPAALAAMLTHLVGTTEIAIDLEHHNFRSFQGFTCLIQLSSRTQDFVIDALALRDSLHQLNAVTADPQIIKVFHGAESDIVWLQRDFGVYVVGLFDTYHASHVLNMPHHSLAHLLHVFCAYDTDKRYQLADWRIRPVPAEMMRYARADTHFLLHIFDRMRNDLVQRGARLVGEDVATPGTPHFGQLAGGIDRVQSAAQPMQVVLQRSAQTALTVYVKDSYDADTGMGPGGWAQLLRKWRQPLTPAQFSVLRALHAWRDACARDEDESTRYVLPNHMLFALATKSPADVPALLAACHPTPPPVRMHAADLVALIARARSAAESRIPEALAHEEAPRPVAPVHTRFADPVDEPVEPVDVLTPDVLASAQAIASPTSALFGPTPPTASDSDAKRRALQVRATLVLQPAKPTTVLAPTEPEFTLVTAKRKRADPIRPAEPVVISETYAEYHAPKQHKPAPPLDAMQLPKIALGDIDDSSDDADEPKVKKSISKKSKKKKTSTKQGVSSADVTPFEYAEDPDLEVIGESAAPVSDKKKKNKKPNRPAKSFDPYSQISTTKELSKKPNRSRVSQKSSNRSMTFKK
ncbi:exosome nuclease subunit [Coemansia aciculifera]|uniref:Exosome nuclease subunit n=1 Tax=Coemansia aciculifera TaxID=417176 RepID=A0A9W8IL58_9FUNG|nr:exosome nuclease subunit [Coemansia aciculifera]KAJ2869585.1 exosome nuclease subunit [Coemansia aciculifera]